MSACSGSLKICRIESSASSLTSSAGETRLVFPPRKPHGSNEIGVCANKTRLVDSALSAIHALSYRLMETFEEKDGIFDILLFPDRGGLAYYTLLAKRAGLILKGTQIWIEAQAPTEWTLEKDGHLPKNLSVLEAAFMERESLRLADGLLSETEEIPLWLEQKGYRLPIRRAKAANEIEKPAGNDPSGSSFPSEQPKVSLVLTSYNRPEELEQAIESVRAQTYKTLELILIDDGSTKPEISEKLKALAPEFAEKGWQIVQDTNHFVGAARNLGARKATGDLLFFLDDDNILMPEAIATLVEARQQTKADILTAANRRFRGSGRPDPAAFPDVWAPLGGALARGAFDNVFGDASFLISRSLFEDLGGFTEDFGIGAEDAEFLAKAVFRGASLFPYPKPLYWYRINPESMSTLTGGVFSEKNRNRSLRPYKESLPNDLGLALAYAVARQEPLPPQKILAQLFRQSAKKLLIKSRMLRRFYFRFRGAPFFQKALEKLRAKAS